MRRRSCRAGTRALAAAFGATCGARRRARQSTTTISSPPPRPTATTASGRSTIPVRAAAGRARRQRARPRAAADDPRLNALERAAERDRARVHRGARRRATAPRSARSSRPGAHRRELTLPVSRGSLRRIARRLDRLPRPARAARLGGRGGARVREVEVDAATAAKVIATAVTRLRRPRRALVRGRHRLPDAWRAGVARDKAELDPLPCGRDRRRAVGGPLSSGLTPGIVRERATARVGSGRFPIEGARISDKHGAFPTEGAHPCLNPPHRSPRRHLDRQRHRAAPRVRRGRGRGARARRRRR